MKYINSHQNREQKTSRRRAEAETDKTTSKLHKSQGDTHCFHRYSWLNVTKQGALLI